MTPSAPETSSADSDDEQSLLSRLLLPIAVTPIVLLPVRSYPVEPVPAILAAGVGLAIGAGLGYFLDRYRSTLERWNDALVIVVFVVPGFLLLVGMSRLLGRDVVGYQAIGMAALLWGTTLQNLLEEWPCRVESQRR